MISSVSDIICFDFKDITIVPYFLRYCGTLCHCNIPISIGRLLDTWLAVLAFSPLVSMSASWSEGSGFVPHSSSFTL